MKRWLIWLPFVAFAAVLWVAADGLLFPAERVVRSKMIDRPLPQFTLQPMLPTKPGLSNAEFGRGEPRLLNVFASWCLPCIAEARQLEQLAAMGAEIDGIAIRDRPEDVAAFLARHGNPYRRIGADDLSEVQLAIGSSGVPETFVIDGAGRIAYQHIGDIRPEHVPVLLGKLAEAGS
jgi:cytochrome c biogenesis protein CcmG/thiol:disulfide interchange protein DsbE